MTTDKGDDANEEFGVSHELAQKILEQERNGEWSEPMTPEELLRKYGFIEPPARPDEGSASGS
ncbi:hypothetical protein [Cupriavidus oxalaticus]|uniref:Uncharacterized protein n=1 Tax=Cupriavidus oxalaticus TaxID=96344 RepID=A0A976BCV6_9BURK|nr:hypothetical protein [Cupriavidus oxalaticus]QRQ88189.1 hypothetical protein JTE91_16495 [Cupriavidus oxalaticus]QRQ93484.1 hypothetical protein JTE92_25765 [Cupriavidus oxalaticus]WQD82109.1 hypothetical protein U0036_13510 [Cupriavidus oxalaticus]SPC14206.1 hypothetical protein CO2235_200062 [Cupriavidus oxalaticus]